MKKLILFLLSCSLSFLSAFVYAAETSNSSPVENLFRDNKNLMPLTPKDVMNLILKQSYRATEIELQAREAQLTLATAEQLFDYQLSADYGYQDSKFESTTQSYLLQDKSLITNVQLAKPFMTGTTLTLQYSSTADQPSYSSTAPTPAVNSTNSAMGLILEQNLWRNFFGEANRAELRSAEKAVKAADLTRLTSLQDLTLNALESYWKTYIAQQTFEEAVNSRNRYAKLVETIKKKTKYGYSSPGELSQTQAELENREQKVKTESVNYLAALEELVTLLKLPPRTEIKFVVNEELAPPPALGSVDIEKLRALQSSQLKLQAAEDNLQASKSRSYPDLSLVGKYYTQGLDENSSTANREMTDGTHPKYYVGMKFQYNFGSGYQAESVRNKKYARDLAETQLQRQRLEVQDEESDLRRRIQSTYAIAQSSMNQKTWREKAVQELTRSYTQGRTDIAILIDAMNKLYDSEVQLTRAIGDYQTTLYQWSAFRDQLISDKL